MDKKNLQTQQLRDQPDSDAKCVCAGGSLQVLKGVTCDQAISVVNASPPGGGQNYEPFQVPGLGSWKTQDQTEDGGGQQPYESAEVSASFMWYSCNRYPEDC
jgi:hypothetical protein